MFCIKNIIIISPKPYYLFFHIYLFIKIFLFEYILWLYKLLSDSSKSVFLFIFLKTNSSNIPTPYSKPAKPNINILEDSRFISSFIDPWTSTKQYKIIHDISEKNNNLTKLLKLLIIDIKLSQKMKLKKFIQFCNGIFIDLFLIWVDFYKFNFFNVLTTL